MAYGRFSEANRMMNRCYAPEFKRVVAQYRMLNGQQAIDEFVERRLEYVASVSKVRQLRKFGYQ